MMTFPVPPQVHDPAGDAGGSPALVVFSGHAELPWLRILRPGYRHCFVIVERRHGPARGWILYNPLSVGTQIELWASVPVDDLAGFFRAQGQSVVITETQPLGQRPWGWRPYTCVEAVKRVLGARAPGVWTPWQLHRHLIIHKTRKKSLTNGNK